MITNIGTVGKRLVRARGLQYGEASVVGEPQIDQEQIRTILLSELRDHEQRLVGILRMYEFDIVAEHLPDHRERDKDVVGVIFDEKNPDSRTERVEIFFLLFFLILVVHSPPRLTKSGLLGFQYNGLLKLPQRNRVNHLPH